MTVLEFDALHDTLKSFIKRCNNSNIVPNEKHIEAYLTTCNSLEMKETFTKFCFYFWDEDNVKEALKSLLPNQIDFTGYDKINTIIKIQKEKGLTGKEIAKAAGVSESYFAQLKKKRFKLAYNNSIEKIYYYLLTL